MLGVDVDGVGVGCVVVGGIIFVIVVDVVVVVVNPFGPEPERVGKLQWLRTTSAEARTAHWTGKEARNLSLGDSKCASLVE